MNRNRFFLLMLVVALFGFQSCDKEDDAPKSDLKSHEIEINSSAFGKWVYVSLEKGEKVGESKADEKFNGADWDIAFCRSDVRLNCGQSGSGKAGVIVANDKKGKSGWEAITEAPKDGYAVDEMTDFMISMQPYKQGKVSTAKTMKGKWVKMKGMGQGYELSGQIFIIKTAKGKYGKIWFKQYAKVVNGKPKGGHITLKYAIQNNGTTDLK